MNKKIEKAKEDLSFFNEGDYITKEMEHSARVLEGYIKQLEQKESVLDKAKDMLVDLRAELEDDEYNYYAKEVTKILNIIREDNI